MELKIRDYFHPLQIDRDAIKDAQKQKQINNIVEENREKRPKATLDTMLNHLFDLIKIPLNSDFEIYTSTLKDIRTAKITNE